MRVAFEDAAVHVGTGIAFVGVANQDFSAFSRLAGEHFPFSSGGESAAAASAKPRGLDFVDDRRRIAGDQDFFQRQISVLSDVIEDSPRIDLLVHVQKHAVLMFEERHIVAFPIYFARACIFVEQFLDGLAFQHGIEN